MAKLRPTLARSSGLAAASCVVQSLTPGVLGFLGLREVLAGQLAELGVGLGLGGHKYPLLKENNRLTRFLNEEETERLRTALGQSENQHLSAIVGLLLVTGARKNEVLRARWEQFDLERRQWRVPKSKSGYHRFIPISDVAYRIIEERRAIGLESRWLFPNPTTGQPFVEIYNSWNTARNRAGLKQLRVHDLRHSFASALVNGGTPLYEVQKLLGHSSIRTTERYAHLAPERLINPMKISDQAFGNVVKAPPSGPVQYELFE